MGELIGPVAKTLIGVDLSANMLEKARQREIYDGLFCCDLTQFLETQDKIFDVVVAADVFVYLGDLSSIFPAVRLSLSNGGLFCFSVEATADGDFLLRNTMRYAHSIGYLQRLAAQHRFFVEMIEPQIIRHDAGTKIDGYLAVLRNSRELPNYKSGG
jgi:predicted TPR repeat methyltransferase